MFKLISKTPILPNCCCAIRLLNTIIMKLSVKEKALEIFEMMKGLSQRFDNQKSYALTYCSNVLKNPVMNDEKRKYWEEIVSEISENINQ